MKRESIKDLKAAYVDIKPVDRDWARGYGETWEYYDGSECEKCGAFLVGTNGESHHDCDGTDCDGHVPLNEGPAMNYAYPLPEWERYGLDTNEAAKRLKDLPLCLVHFAEDDTYALALTGGGMDLSWEICEAFMRLGYLPPFHFCDLPKMAGRGQSASDRWIIAGCRASAQVIKNRAGWTLRNLRQQFKQAA